MWSFVGNKGNKQWIWLALDVEPREIIGVHIGDRSEQGAKKLWDSLPSVYRQCAVAYTDFWRAYALVFPAQRHKPVGKESVVKPIILSGLTVRCGNVSPD